MRMDFLSFLPMNNERWNQSTHRSAQSLDPSYRSELSQASVETLAQQGGDMAPAELDAFLSREGSGAAMRLRRYDDRGKVRGMAVEGGLEGFRDLIYEHLRGASLARR